MSYLLFLGGTRPLNFFMTDSTDHVTGKTGLSPTVTIRKVGGSFASPSGAVSEIANGWYTVAGNATDCNTAGPVLLHATATGADPTDTSYDCVAWNPDVASLPNAAAGASGGLLISGSNSGTTTLGALTITGATVHTGNVSMAAGLTITQSTTNGAGLSVAGNGTGAGILATGGATGIGVSAVGGATSGSAIKAVGTAGNAVALELVGQGSAAGLKTTGGATGNGATFAGGATSGHGLQATTVGSNEIDADITGTLSALSTSALNAIADAVLDEATSGHLAVGSLGAVLAPTDQGTAQAGGANTITLRSGAVASDDYYNKQLLKIVAGTGLGQSEYISDYVGSTKVATMGASWVVQPDATSIYVVLPGGTIPGASAPTAAEVADAVLDEAMSGHTSAGTLGQYLNSGITRTGTAQAGTTSSITLDAGASATNNLYKYHGVEIIGGTGAGEVSFITGYTGSSKVATVDPAFAVAPDNTSVFALRKYGIDAATPAQVATAVWAATRAGNATAGSFGEYVFADMTRISGDATAADNLEAFTDGTGYAGTNNVIPTVTTVTTVNGFSNDSITAAAVAADAVTEIQTGLATSSVLSTVSTNVDSILADTGTDGVVVAAASKTGYTLSNTGIDALFTRQLTESYATDGAAPTVAQALMQIQQYLTEFGISGTTYTVKKLDGSTTAFTLTLNSASAPTSATRAT